MNWELIANPLRGHLRERVPTTFDRRVKLKSGVYVRRRAFVIQPEHVGASLSRYHTATRSDVGSVYIWDDYPDGTFVDSIVRRSMHPAQWQRHGYRVRS